MAKPGHKHKRTIGSAAGASNKQPPHQQSSATTSKGKGGGRGKPQQAQAAAMSGTGVHKRGQLEEESEEEQDIFDDDGSLSGSEEDDEEGSGSDSEGEESGSELEDDGLAGATGFTDENQAWLKPKAKKGGKQQLLSSDEEGDEGASSDEDEDEDEDDEDDDEFGQLPLGVEGSEDGEEEEDEEDEEEEEGSEGAFGEEEDDEDEFEAEEYEGEEGEEGKDDKGRALGLPEDMKRRIEEVVETLSDFRARRNPGAPRSEYTRRLAWDLSEHYGYLPELTDMFLSMFSPAECVEFMAANDKPRPLVIRTNTLKTRRKDLAEALVKRGVSLEPLSAWSKVALKIVDSQVPVGATPEYLAGQYILQSASSMQPVMALGPQPGEKVLDMSAAPGGKSSYCAQLMKNTGLLVANDLKPARQKATVGNLHRLGVRNALVVSYDGRKLPTVMKGFDRVLLDAPCSGLGIVARDQSVKFQRNLKDIRKMSHLQKELLRAAVDCVDAKSKTGGYVVYSTCSVSVEENELVVNYILKTRPNVKLVETGLEMGKEGFTRFKEHRFHPSLALTRRFYPHVHNMDGFFVAKFKKLANQTAPPSQKQQADGEEAEEGEGGVDKEGSEGEEGQEEEAASEGGSSSDSDDEPKKKKEVKRKGKWKGKAPKQQGKGQKRKGDGGGAANGGGFKKQKFAHTKKGKGGDKPRK